MSRSTSGSRQKADFLPRAVACLVFSGSAARNHGYPEKSLYTGVLTCLDRILFECSILNLLWVVNKLLMMVKMDQLICGLLKVHQRPLYQKTNMDNSTPNEGNTLPEVIPKKEDPVTNRLTRHPGLGAPLELVSGQRG